MAFSYPPTPPPTLPATMPTAAAPNDFALQGDITPTQIVAVTNDWSPTGISTATIVRVSTDANRFLNGITGGADGRMLIIQNVGTQILSLGHENVGSTAANRFHLSSGTDIQVPADGSVILVYDTTLSRWRDTGRTFIGRNGDVAVGTSTTVATSPANLMASAAVITLTYSSGVAWDTSLGYNATVTLGGNGIIGAPTNVRDGITYSLELVQDGTGTRVPTWNSYFDWGASGAPVLQTAIGKADKVFFQHNARTGKGDASFRKGA